MDIVSGQIELDADSVAVGVDGREPSPRRLPNATLLFRWDREPLREKEAMPAANEPCDVDRARVALFDMDEGCTPLHGRAISSFVTVMYGSSFGYRCCGPVYHPAASTVSAMGHSSFCATSGASRSAIACESHRNGEDIASYELQVWGRSQ